MFFLTQSVVAITESKDPKTPQIVIWQKADDTSIFKPFLTGSVLRTSKNIFADPLQGAITPIAPYGSATATHPHQ